MILVRWRHQWRLWIKTCVIRIKVKPFWQLLSKPRLQLGYVKQLITEVIKKLKNEENSDNPLYSLDEIATLLNVNENEFKPLLKAINEKAKQIPESDRDIIKSKFRVIMNKITKKLERDFK